MATTSTVSPPVVSLQSKLPNIGTSIFSEMSKMATQYDAINLSQGFPDFDCDPRLIGLVSEYMQKGFNQYAPSNGLFALRSILADKINKSYDANVDPEKEITITAGATQALFTTINSLVKEGDEVLLVDPAYDSYGPSVKLAGGLPISVPLRKPNYSIPWDEVKQKISFRTRMIVLNYPHNPSGAILREADLIELQRIVEGTNIVILSDEVYEHLVYDGEKHLSLLGSKLADRTIAVYSFGKAVHATGWKLGYCVAPPFLMKEFRKVHQFNVFSVNTPIQMALADYYADSSVYENITPFYQSKRDFFLSLMQQSKFKFLPTKGTYFQLMNFSEVAPDMKDREFVEWLVKEHGVAAIPISGFYSDKIDDQMVRFCFAKKEETLTKAAEKLCQI